MKSLLFLLVSLCTIPLSWAQDLSKVPPIDLGILDSLIGKAPGSDEPGLAVGIIRGNEVILEQYYGLADIEAKTPISVKTKFNLASVSKQFTAYGILLLQNQGKIDLHTPVAQYLKSFPYSDAITPMQLLHHTSGIPSSDNLRVFAGLSLESDWGRKDELRLNGRYRKLNFAPGENFLYSNSGYFYLGELIESQSGLSYADFFEETLFPALNMNGVVLDRPGKSVSDMAIPYQRIEDRFERKYPEKSTITGESNIYLDLPSTMLWMQHLLQSNHVEGHFVGKMFDDAQTLSNGATIDYNYGLEKRKINSLTALTHGGGVPGYSSYVIYIPELDLGISVLSNSEKLPKSPGQIAFAIARFLTAGFAQPEEEKVQTEISLTVDVTQKYVGEYRFWDGNQFEIKQEESGLFVYLPDAPPFQLHPKSDTVFFIKEFDAEVAFTINNNSITLEFIQGKKSDSAAKLDPHRKKAQSPTADRLVGTYENEALEVDYEVTQRDGILMLTLPETLLRYAGFNEVELIPIEGNTFRTQELGVIEWEVSNEIVTGFTFRDLGRIRNLHFRKKF